MIKDSPERTRSRSPLRKAGDGGPKAAATARDGGDSPKLTKSARHHLRQRAQRRLKEGKADAAEALLARAGGPSKKDKGDDAGRRAASPTPPRNVRRVQLRGADQVAHYDRNEAPADLSTGATPRRDGARHQQQKGANWKTKGKGKGKNKNKNKGKIKNKDKGKMKQKDNKGKQGGNLRNRLWLPSRKGAGKNKGKQNKKGKGGKGGKKGQGNQWQ